MTELKLKTLKDIPATWKCREEIKKEAIKWVKEDMGQIEADKLMPTPTRILLKHLTRKWMKRHNITEEDLQ